MTFVVSNLGPANAQDVEVVSSIPIPAGTLSLAFDGCSMLVSGSTALSYAWRIGQLQPSESRQCIITIFALATAAQALVPVGFRVREVSGLTFDPNDGPFGNLAGETLPVSPVDVVSDLALSVAREPAGFMPPGTRGLITVTLENRGPDTAASPGVITSAYRFGDLSNEMFRLFGVAETTCGLSASDVGGQSGNGSRRLILQFDPIAAGESRSCVIGIESTAFAVGNRTLGFSVFIGGFGVFDPTLADNVQSLLLTFTALAIPAVNRSTLALLSVLLLVAGLARADRGLRRSHNSHRPRQGEGTAS